jgi:hypothetical protein
MLVKAICSRTGTKERRTAKEASVNTTSQYLSYQQNLLTTTFLAHLSTLLTSLFSGIFGQKRSGEQKARNQQRGNRGISSARQMRVQGKKRMCNDANPTPAHSQPQKPNARETGKQQTPSPHPPPGR